MVEAEWVQKAQAGDREACIRLLREVETAVYRTAYYLMGNEHDALDATQEALLASTTGFPPIRGNPALKPGRSGLSPISASTTFRRKKREVPYPEEIHPADPKAGPAVERAGVVMDLREAIRRLPPPQRTAIVLRYMHDFSYEEIAEAMELPLNTVKSHLFRARKELQEWLSEYQEGGVVP